MVSPLATTDAAEVSGCRRVELHVRLSGLCRVLLADEPAGSGLGDRRHLVSACHYQLLRLPPLADVQIAWKLANGVLALLCRLWRSGLVDDVAHPRVRDNLEVQRLCRFIHPKRCSDSAVVLGAQDVFFPNLKESDHE